jgi:hypothetical protein
MVNRTPEIATLLRQKPAAAEGRMAKSTPTLDALRDRMEALRRDQNALRERMATLLRGLQATAPPPRPGPR